MAGPAGTPEMTPFASADPLEATVRLWTHLAEPVDAVRATEALIGLTQAAARLTAAVVLTTSPEVDRLVDGLPGMIRKLAVATNARNERHMGEIRGPIVWSETLAARSASAGDPQLYVCASVTRAYDTPENRVLVAALRAIVAAAVLVDRQGLRRRNSALARHVRHNEGLAVRYLDHRALNGISRGPDRRDVARARAGKRRGTYEPALSVLRRAASPIGADHIAALGSRRAQAQHAALGATIEALVARGVHVPKLRPAGGALVGGPISFVNDEVAARTGQAAGIGVGDLLLDVPVDAAGAPVPGEHAFRSLTATAGSRPCAVVNDPGDVGWALDQYGVTSRA